MKILFAAGPAYGLTLPLVPLMWAARAAGHEVVLATTAEMAGVAAEAGLATVDVFPERDVFADLLRLVRSQDEPGDDLPEEYRMAGRQGNPFGMFTATMTEGTIEAARTFGPDIVVYPQDHGAGPLAAVAVGAHALEVGNRVSWSTRDIDWRTNHPLSDQDTVSDLMRRKLDLGDARPKLIARVDVRPPSMGGIAAGEEHSDDRDDVPWWPMRYVPYNGGAVVPEWTLRQPDRPRIAVTLGTVVPIIQGVSNLSMVIDALGGMDVDVVLAGGKADLTELGDLPANVRSVGYLPLSTFLPTCSVIVHHGGSGTTAAPLYYGVPQLVMPAFADNPLSAGVVADRGVGVRQDPATADARTVRTLVERLLTEPGFRTAATEVAAEMAGQPSPASVLERAVSLLG